ncbi:nitric oxide reductase activation protein NorD [Hoeflea sp. TYP-13]|uniref:nitric oxide reductase activation protein NorD n=1 Tax=Hoeflea sp. TYP-13 TaxID=3230023 RepID=UPI0034C5B9A4
MTGIEYELWEPEETVGKLWHSFASRLDAPEVHEGAAVGFDEVDGRLAVFFRGLGGGRAVEIKSVTPEISRHRLSWRRRVATPDERIARSSFDGECLRLPSRIAEFPQREANASLFFWLTATAAHAVEPIIEEDPLRADLRALSAAWRMTQNTLADCPGLRSLFDMLAQSSRDIRRERSLPAVEKAVEQTIHALLGGESPKDRLACEMIACVKNADAELGAFVAPKGYRPFLPVPLWPDLRQLARSAATEVETPDTDGAPQESKEGAHRARRRKTDQAERGDSLNLHRFEAILSWTEFLNINRRVDDDDPDNAKKAAEDHDEIVLGQISKAPATRLKLHLDLAPEDVDRERLSGAHVYPEWDARSGNYLPEHCRVLASEAETTDESAPFNTDDHAHRRIRAVRRQFEALQPRRISLPGQPDGDDLDLEAAVRSQVDLKANGRGTQRIWRDVRPLARDLAVSILLDTSRSTESAVTGRAVIDIEREALTALAWGLSACGDDFAINAFSSLRRDRVYLRRCKDFSERMDAEVEARIAGLKPGFYTRLGAAVRHVSADLALQPHQRRLLLVITDGKPNDLDHYEGRHGIEDSRMAIREARRAGQAVFGVTIDAKAKSWFPRIFGRGGYAVISNPDRLTTALPEIYRQLVGE